MAVKSLEKKSEKDLQKDLQKKRMALRDIRFGTVGSKSQKPHEPKMLRKEIAQILTELHNRVTK
jgi:ribosomal protein L29